MITLSTRMFAGRSGRGVRIAVVDSGIHASHPHVGRISSGIAIDGLGRAGGDAIDRLGHGTAVAAAIREKAPDAELVAVKVFDRALTATGVALVRAIEWSADADVRIINLSLGTVNQEHAALIGEAVHRADRLGAILVTAAPQQNAHWLPGGLTGVVTVDVDWNCPRDEGTVLLDPSGAIRVFASGYPRPIPGVPPERNFSGLSFAVANASGLLALALEGHAPRSLEALAARLRDGRSA